MQNRLTRREFGILTGMGIVGMTAFDQTRAGAKELLLYVGTYTGAKSPSEGIYVYRMDLSTGELVWAHTVKDVVSPSFLTIDPTKRFLYAVNEVGEFKGKKGGGVTAFAIDSATGDLKKLNEQGATGVPCYVSVHPSGRFVLAANYGGGSLVVYPVNADGSLGPQSDYVQHAGKGGDPKRQDGPHAHAIMPDAAGNYFFAPDLGIDRVMIYKLNLKTGKLISNGAAATRPASGPRHFDFHPSGKYAYVINELDSTVTAFTYNAAKGELKEIQSLSTLPAGFNGTNYCADLHVHPSGKFLYGSNRGHDSIVAFAIDAATGKLSFIGHQLTLGKWPRNFGIDPTGAFLLAANQNTNNVSIFRIDSASGKLSETGKIVEIPSPVCLRFLSV
jgi:6-phosphogluconolactonase